MPQGQVFIIQDARTGLADLDAPIFHGQTDIQHQAKVLPQLRFCWRSPFQLAYVVIIKLHPHRRAKSNTTPLRIRTDWDAIKRDYSTGG